MKLAIRLIKNAAAISAITAQRQRFMSVAQSYLECMKDPQIEHVLKRDGAAVLANRASWPSQVS